MAKTTLLDVCDALSDGLHKAPVFSDDGEYLFVNALNLSDGYIIDTGNGKRSSVGEWKKYGIELNERTILYSIDGTIGNMARYRGEKCILGKGACYIKLNDTVDVDYMYYLLQSEHFKGYLRSMQTGSTIHHISLETMRKYPLPPMPQIDVQRLIGGLLAGIDREIDNNKNLMEEIEATARLIYDYWFTQFDFPDENGKPYRSNGGKLVWNDALKQDIPEAWHVECLGTICDTRLGGTPDTEIEEYWGGDMPWLSSAEVAVSPILEAEKRITARGQRESATSFAEAGSILLSITRYIRPSILAIDACFNQSVVAVLENETLRTPFLYPFIQSQVPRYMTLRTGAQQPHINKETVDSTLVLIPSQEVLTEYYDRIDSLFEQLIVSAKQNLELASLRDWLLPMLMNGQATIGE